MGLFRLYGMTGEGFEACYNIETSAPLTDEELRRLHWLLADRPETVLTERSAISGAVAEIGPRLSFATPFSSNAVSIFQGCGLGKITRCEVSRRYELPYGVTADRFAESRGLIDRMTQQLYAAPLEKFETALAAEGVRTIPLLSEGADALRRVSSEMGFGWDEQDIAMVDAHFRGIEQRDPTDVELFQWAQANSEHSRHHFFKAKLVIDGQTMPDTLLELVMRPWRKRPGGSVIAFDDNSSAVRGFDGVTDLVPLRPDGPSLMSLAKLHFHLLLTAETHNFPTGVAPLPGAETGTGGRIRDSEATGRGSSAIAGTAAYCVGHLHLPGYRLPWETDAEYPDNLARPLEILIRASDGASDYGNKFGEPVIAGFSHSLELELDDGTRWAFLKPIMFTGGIGRIQDRDLRKEAGQTGDFVVQIGGPAYRIGFGGGSASSQIQGDNRASLDFNAVQRGDAEMEQRARRAIRACVEMAGHGGTRSNPIRSIHDQGAGGPCNVVTELVSPAGGRIDIRQINLGDPTLPVIAIWGAEYQERYGLLVRGDDDLCLIRKICVRENVPCEVLGRITGDGRITVIDSSDGTVPVNMNLESVLGKLPQKTFRDSHAPARSGFLRLPGSVTIQSALDRVLRMVSVGSKEHYVHKVDRSVTGLVARQQCCGPRQLPVSDVAVVALSHFDVRGGATAIGERPLAMLADPLRGARLSAAEALSNLVWAGGVSLPDVRASVNWMWPAKLPGEMAAMHDAAYALSEFMSDVGMAADGGKDSVSMAARVGGRTVKSPREVVVSAYAAIPDVRRVITPDLKSYGGSRLVLIDVSNDRGRLGGSALAYAYGQLGREVPDVHANVLVRAFVATQQLIALELVLSGHDIGDGGLIVTLLEMCFSGMCGAEISLPHVCRRDFLPFMFSEGVGWVIECLDRDLDDVRNELWRNAVPHLVLGRTVPGAELKISMHGETPVTLDCDERLKVWRETSHRLRREQINPECADAERRNTARGPVCPIYSADEPAAPSVQPDQWRDFSVAVLREEGTNGDREMAASFHLAGFRVHDVTMSDLTSGRESLDGFRGLVFPGGFSYADTLGSAKGWAAKILFDDRLRGMFDEFRRRPDTFSLGVCNGCQLMALLGWVPGLDSEDAGGARFVRNESRKFESRWSAVTILPSPAVMLRWMEGQILGIWVAHGEGRLEFSDDEAMKRSLAAGLAPVRYVDGRGALTERYPFNPNGSPLGITALCSPDGRHLAMMPHPERCTLMWQWPWVRKGMQHYRTSPWLKMFVNALEWCNNNR